MFPSGGHRQTGADPGTQMFDNANTVFVKAARGSLTQPQPVVVWLGPGTCMLRFLPVYA
jgi:hypothetical protein